MHKKKIAVCISGHFRSFETTRSSLSKYLLENPNIECDVFIHTWDAIDRHVYPGISERKLYREFKPKKMVIEQPKIFPITSKMRRQNLNKRDINGLLCMFYKIEACNQLKMDYEKEHGFIYDLVIRCRADVEFRETLDINSMDPSKLYIPLHGDYNGLNDQMAISNSFNMNNYSSTFSHIEEYLDNKILLNPEFFVKETVEKYHLLLERFDFKYFILWSNGWKWDNKTRFDPAVMNAFKAYNV